MKTNGNFELRASNFLREKHGIAQGGYVQRFIDNECIRLMAKYTPFRSGALIRSATIHTVIGSGKIVQSTPYARYLYYGEKYEPSYPIIRGGVLEGFYSPIEKHASGKPLKYDTSKNPNAGCRWFEVMKRNHKRQIVDGANELIRRHNV